MKFVKNLVITFVVLFVLTFLWHNVLLADFYTTNLGEIGRFTGDKLTPLVSFLALANLLSAIAFVVFVPAVAKKSADYLWYGLLMGFLTTGFFAMASHSIFSGWTGNLAFADTSYGVISGFITGWVLSMLNKKA